MKLKTGRSCIDTTVLRSPCQPPNMVHLSHIPNPEDVKDHLAEELKKVHLESFENDDFTTSVYGSKFASQDLPRYEIPDGEMPKEVAYRLIKDELSLDGNPMLKYVLAGTRPSLVIFLVSS